MKTVETQNGVMSFWKKISHQTTQKNRGQGQK